jgi:hypothetical protein
MDEGRDFQNVGAWNHLVAAEGGHLRDARFRMGRIDSNPDRFKDRLGRTAP